MPEIRDLPVISANPSVQARYEELRAEGQGHNFAEMLATRRFPGIKTDAIWNEGRTNGSQFEKCPARGDHLKGIAEAAGVSTTGKTYLASLADYYGDPKAWVSSRGDVQRVAAEKGFKVSGYVNYEPPEAKPMDTVPIAQDLIDREVAEIMEDHPGARREDVQERVYDLRTGKVDNHPLRVKEHPCEDLLS